MLKYLYIDESGDLGERGSKYLIIACLIIQRRDLLDRIIKNMRRYKFRKQLKKAQEIKANKSKPPLVKWMLTKLNELDMNVHFIVLEKGKVYSDYLKTNRHKLYKFVSGKLGQKIIVDGYDLEIRIDKSKDKQILRDDFNSYFKEKLNENSSINKILIHHSYSESWSGLQFADVLAWACFQKFEHGNNEYLNLINPEKREINHTF